MQSITEEMKIHEEWYKQSNDVTVEALPDFIKHLTEDYQHNYGSICHAIVAGALATIHAIDKSPMGGITGFQAGCIMWELIRRLSYQGNKCGLRILDYDNLLYPQHEDKFGKTITPSIWENVQHEAKERIKDYETEVARYQRSVEEYPAKLESFYKIVEEYRKANPNEPSYENNPGYYQELSCGTAAEWEEYEKRKEAGVPMKPREPYFGGACDEVLNHWKSIVDGIVPFGFRVEED